MICFQDFPTSTLETNSMDLEVTHHYLSNYQNLIVTTHIANSYIFKKYFKIFCTGEGMNSGKLYLLDLWSEISGEQGYSLHYWLESKGGFF